MICVRAAAGKSLKNVAGNKNMQNNFKSSLRI
jgi:hypothetical protein